MNFISSLPPTCSQDASPQPHFTSGNAAGTWDSTCLLFKTQPRSHTHHFCSHFFGLNAVTSAHLAAKETEKSSL